MKVLFTSGHTKDVIVHHGVLADGFHLLEKPFTQVALAARIRACSIPVTVTVTARSPTATQNSLGTKQRGRLQNSEACPD